jgi:hypothetical protein
VISNSLLKTIIVIILKIILLGIAGFYLLEKTSSKDFTEAFNLLATFSNKQSFWLFIGVQILAMIAQWFIEAKRWQLLLANVQELSYFKCFKVVLMSSTLGNLTPYKLGDYAGKMIGVEPEKRKKALLRAVIASFCNTEVILFFGLIGLIAVDFKTDLDFNIKLFSFLAVIVLILFNVIITTLQRFIYFKYYIKTSVYTKALLLTIVKYLIYSSQLAAWVLFISDSSFTNEYLFYAWITFGIQSFLPSIFLVDLGIRGAVSLFVWSKMGIATSIILSSVSLLWAFNIVIPMLVGLVWLLKLKIHKVDTSKHSFI